MREILNNVKIAGNLLQAATDCSPACSNLRDDLENIIEQVRRVQNALAANGYDLAGMEK